MFKAKKIRQKNYFIIYRYMKNKNELITISNTFQVFSKTSIVQLTYNMCYRPFVVVLKKKQPPTISNLSLCFSLCLNDYKE